MSRLEQTDACVAGVRHVLGMDGGGAGGGGPAFSLVKGCSLSNTICTTYLGPCGGSVTGRICNSMRITTPLGLIMSAALSDKTNTQTPPPPRLTTCFCTQTLSFLPSPSIKFNCFLMWNYTQRLSTAFLDRFTLRVRNRCC